VQEEEEGKKQALGGAMMLMASFSEDNQALDYLSQLIHSSQRRQMSLKCRVL
jgi:hypothetical protein